MPLRTTQILGLLEQDPTRSIEYGKGRYRMKEEKGGDVTMSENGQVFLIEPTKEHMDDLKEHSQLLSKGSRYWLRHPPSRKT
jgi:hypothetical protein